MRNFLKIAGLCAFAACGALARAADVSEGVGPAPDPGAGPTAAALSFVAPPERRWRLGVALGYGERSNPLIQADAIPVIVDVDIAWFGKRWFFDNGDLGFSLVDHARFTTNVVARVNSDRAFFSKTNTRYITFTRLAGGVSTPAFDPETGSPLTTPVPLRPPRRDYAVELGFETLFDGEWGAATVRAFHDVSGAHDGYEIGADYSYRLTRGRLSLAPSLGVAWKSSRLSDYYWGVHPDEASFLLPGYRADAGLGWEAGLRGSYYLSKRVRLAASVNYERLQHSVAQSPLVSSPYVLAYFTGLAWSF